MSDSDLAKRYIGKQISLISTSHVRYEGYLYTIDEQAQTVALQNVVCMGTEGRRHGDQAIGPSDTTYEFIIFRGVNIQHFYVKSDESVGKPTVDKTAELFAALGIEDEEALYGGGGGGGRHYGSSSRHKERPSSRLVLADDTPKRRVGRGDMSPREDYYYQHPRPYYQYRDPWGYPPSYPRGAGYSRGPVPRGRRDRGRPRYDDRYDNRGGGRRSGGQDPDRQRGGDGGRRRGGSDRKNTNASPPRRGDGGGRRSRRNQSKDSENNGGGRRERQSGSSRRAGGQNSRQQMSGGSGGGGGGGGSRRRQAGTGEFLTKAGRGEELEINEDQLFDFDEAKTKFTRSGDAEAKGGDDMGENKVNPDSVENEEPYNGLADESKINESNESADVAAASNLSATDDTLTNTVYYDASKSFFDSLSTDNAQRTKSGRPDMNEQRNVDAKTFGSIAQTYKSSHLRPSGGNRSEKSRKRRPNKTNQNRSRRRSNNRRQRAPPVQRQWQPRQ